MPSGAAWGTWGSVAPGQAGAQNTAFLLCRRWSSAGRTQRPDPRGLSLRHALGSPPGRPRPGPDETCSPSFISGHSKTFQKHAAPGAPATWDCSGPHSNKHGGTNDTAGRCPLPRDPTGGCCRRHHGHQVSAVPGPCPELPLPLPYRPRCWLLGCPSGGLTSFLLVSAGADCGPCRGWKDGVV